MNILNFRLGFATNSSSTHSIVFFNTDEELQRLIKIGKRNAGRDDYYGWDLFVLTDKLDKARYLASQLNLHLKSNATEFSDEEIGSIVCDRFREMGYKITVRDLADIDHDSVVSIPTHISVLRKNITYHDREFLSTELDFFCQLSKYIIENNFVITGGNDNTGKPDFTQGNNPLDHLMFAFLQSGSRKYVYRFDKQSGVYTLFNMSTGVKVHVNFSATPDQVVSTTEYYPSSPELIDIKITDYCPIGCPYCYQNSTESGVHATWGDLSNLIDEFARREVFEIAIGGGEPTMHPKFAVLLRKCRTHGIVANFTTKSVHWFKNREILQEVLISPGSFAFSVDSSHEVERVHEKFEHYSEVLKEELTASRLFEDALYNMHHTEKMVFQYVLEAHSKDNLKYVLKAVSEIGGQITLLGYKTVGRGDKCKQYDLGDWIQLIKELQKQGRAPSRIGIDTAIANRYKDLLDKHDINGALYYTEEGRFSMYIDAVKLFCAPSSYCESKEHVSFSSLGDANNVLSKFNLLEYFTPKKWLETK